MESKTFTVPNISCGHCTHTIETEVSELAGVNSVKAAQDNQQVTVEWVTLTVILKDDFVVVFNRRYFTQKHQ